MTNRLRRSATILLLLAASPAGAAGAERRVGVLIAGDARDLAPVRRAFDAALGAVPGVTVRGVDDLLPFVAAPAALTASAWANDPSARSRFETALASAQKAYFSDAMSEATARLDEAAAVVEGARDVPGAARARVPLWRAAVASRLGKAEAAESEVRVALLLVPNLVPDANTPPAVVDLLAAERARAGRPISVRLAGVPANALVKVDDVVLPASGIAVLPGAHVLDVVAPGYRPYSRGFEAASDLSIEVALVPAFAAGWEKVFDALSRGVASDADREALAALAAKDRLDALVIAVAHGAELRAGTWIRETGDTSSSTGTVAAAAALAGWSAKQIAPGATTVARPVHRGGGGKKIQVATEAGLAAVAWFRAVESRAGGGGYEVPGLSGGGPRVRVQLSRGGLVGVVEGAYLRFGPIEATAPPPGDGTVSVSGGSMFAGRLGGGWRVRLGPHGDASASVTAGLGGFHERYAAQDIARSGVFPSHVRTGLEARVGARLPISSAALLVEVGVVPFSTWTEDPAGATGSDPTPALDPRWRVGGVFTLGARSRLVVEYAGELRTIAFSGTGTSALAPVEASREEMLHVAGLSWRYAF